jgi:hypothetical protein
MACSALFPSPCTCGTAAPGCVLAFRFRPEDPAMCQTAILPVTPPSHSLIHAAQPVAGLTCPRAGGS